MKKCLLSLAVLAGTYAHASPWIEVSQSDLKHSIDLLVAEGVINRPVNQYPLLWSGIVNDLAMVEERQLSKTASFALAHLRHALKQAKRSKYSSVTAHFNGAETRSTGFGERKNERSGLRTYGVITGASVSAKVAVNYADEGQDGKYINHHGTHLAVLFGNWSLSAERLSYWWGPSNENALMLSNNAAPMKAVRLSRANNNYIGPSFFSFVGPWQITAIMAKQRPSLTSKKKGDFWGFRAAAFPLQGLELGFSTTYSDFVYQQQDLESEKHTQRLTSVDFKYSTRLGNQPLAFYGEFAGNNESGALPSDPMYTLGVESYWGGNDYRLKGFVEYSDTSIECSNELKLALCPRNNTVDSAYYSERDLWLGASSGLDAKNLTLALDYFSTDGMGIYAKLKRVDYETVDVERNQLDVGYQQGVFGTLAKIGVRAWQDKSAQDDDSHAALTLSIEYQF
ncbi:capsule assembly Wzi family protein [Pseudoalteromonas piscicida]|uniref:capsule assembly Wzi family protein n=1 Tax=Pseudoalteromonas piscicida TaxID=43662 RepID=UPI0030B121B1